MSVFIERAISFDRGAGPEEGHTYLFPKIQESFSSPLVNERNLEVSAGGPWQDVVRQVTNDLKPVGFVESGEGQMREAAKCGLEAGCAVQNSRYAFSSGGACWFTSVAQTGRIEERFDIESLIADYRAYFAEHPKVAEAIGEELAKLGRFDISCYLDFSDVEADLSGVWKDEKSAGAEYARCGLLLGYPVWSTVAVIGKTLKLPGYATSIL